MCHAPFGSFWDSHRLYNPLTTLLECVMPGLHSDSRFRLCKGSVRFLFGHRHGIRQFSIKCDVIEASKSDMRTACGPAIVLFAPLDHRRAVNTSLAALAPSCARACT